MNFELRAQGLNLTRRLCEHVEDRLRANLGRFSADLQGIRIQLTDLNGPRGGEDIQCLVLARGRVSGQVVIQERTDDAFAAVARACDRAAFSLARRLDRARSRRQKRA